MPRNRFRCTHWLPLTAALLLAGCSLQMPQHRSEEPFLLPPAQSTVVNPTVPPASVSMATARSVSQADATPPVSTVLAYADRVRGMAPAELVLELSRLSDARSPMEQMQLALVLAQHRQPPEMIRAQDALTRLLANASPDALALHPLARLLANRFGEQRRFEDALDKQTQQTRDTQRRLEQTTERLEALKAMERSLGGQSDPKGRSPALTAPRRPSNPP